MNKTHEAFTAIMICGLFLFYKYVAQLFPSLIVKELINEMRLSGIQIGIFASSYYYSYSIMQIFSGILLDKYRLKFFLCFAIFTTSIGVYIFSKSHTFNAMCFSRILIGLGCAFATTLYLKTAAIYTSKKLFTIVSSLLATATMLGAAIGAAPISLFLHEFGWKQGLTYISWIGVSLSLLSLTSIKSKNNPTQKSFVLKASIKNVIKNSCNLKLLLYSGLTFSPIIVMGGLWGIPFLELKLHNNTNTTAFLISIMFLGHAIGSPIWSIINTYINNCKLLMFVSNVFSFITICIIIYYPANYIEMKILLLFFGFFVSCFMLSFDVCLQVNSAALMGISVAFINSGEGIIGVLLEPGIGFILDHLKTQSTNSFSLVDYQIALSLLPICYIISSVISLKLPRQSSLREQTA